MNFLSLFKRKIIYNLKKKVNIDKDGFNHTSLDDLFHHYGSDKSNKLKFQNTQGHGFARFYEKHLKKYYLEKIKILEIGSFSGASAASFSKYFKNAKVFCFDINISNFKYKSENIYTYGVDIRDERKIKILINSIFQKFNIQGFDIIIDDGSHNLSDMLSSLKFFFNYLNKEGTFILEDFKFPNYYERNKDVDDILISDLINNLKEKKLFQSKILDADIQKNFFQNIQSIETHDGNLNISNICFIKRK